MDQKLTAGVAQGKWGSASGSPSALSGAMVSTTSQVKEATQSGQMRRQRAAPWRLKWLRLGKAVRHHGH